MLFRCIGPPVLRSSPHWFDSVRIVIFVGAAALGLISCTATESLFFEHGPSDRYYADKNYRTQELNPYRVGSFTILSSLKESRHGEYTLWITVCDQGGSNELRLLSAVLSLEGGTLAVPTPDLGTAKVAGGIGRTSTCSDFGLIALPVERLRSAQSGDAGVRFSIEASADSAPSVRITYDFKVRRERRTVFPT